MDIHWNLNFLHFFELDDVRKFGLAFASLRNYWIVPFDRCEGPPHRHLGPMKFAILVGTAVDHIRKFLTSLHPTPLRTDSMVFPGCRVKNTVEVWPIVWQSVWVKDRRTDRV